MSVLAIILVLMIVIASIISLVQLRHLISKYRNRLHSVPKTKTAEKSQSIYLKQSLLMTSQSQFGMSQINNTSGFFKCLWLIELTNYHTFYQMARGDYSFPQDMFNRVVVYQILIMQVVFTSSLLLSMDGSFKAVIIVTMVTLVVFLVINIVCRKIHIYYKKVKQEMQEKSVQHDGSFIGEQQSIQQFNYIKLYRILFISTFIIFFAVTSINQIAKTPSSIINIIFIEIFVALIIDFFLLRIVFIYILVLIKFLVYRNKREQMLSMCEKFHNERTVEKQMLRWKKSNRKVGVFQKYFSSVKKIDEEEKDQDSEQILKEDETKTQNTQQIYVQTQQDQNDDDELVDGEMNQEMIQQEILRVDQNIEQIQKLIDQIKQDKETLQKRKEELLERLKYAEGEERERILKELREIEQKELDLDEQLKLYEDEIKEEYKRKQYLKGLLQNNQQSGQYEEYMEENRRVTKTNNTDEDDLLEREKEKEMQRLKDQYNEEQKKEGDKVYVINGQIMDQKEDSEEFERYEQDQRVIQVSDDQIKEEQEDAIIEQSSNKNSLQTNNSNDVSKYNQQSRSILKYVNSIGSLDERERRRQAEQKIDDGLIKKGMSITDISLNKQRQIQMNMSLSSMDQNSQYNMDGNRNYQPSEDMQSEYSQMNMLNRLLDSRGSKIVTRKKNQNYMEYSERNSENSYSDDNNKKQMGKTDNWKYNYTMQDQTESKQNVSIKKKRKFKYIDEEKFDEDMHNKFSEKSVFMSRIYEENSDIQNKKLKKVKTHKKQHTQNDYEDMMKEQAKEGIFDYDEYLKQQEQMNPALKKKKTQLQEKQQDFKKKKKRKRVKMPIVSGSSPYQEYLPKLVDKQMKEAKKQQKNQKESDTTRFRNDVDNTKLDQVQKTYQQNNQTIVFDGNRSILMNCTVRDRKSTINQTLMSGSKREDHSLLKGVSNSKHISGYSPTK